MVEDEKDRLGDKLRDVGRAREDEYFAKRDRALLEKLRRGKDDDAEKAAREAALMRCPKCGTGLQEISLRGVTVDECPDCHGMWLDHRELEAVARDESDGWIARWLRGEFRKTE